ncbi:MAG TPA: PIN domain-containing protein, partial [Gammaproteobacteria bacterium]|nr:PIN domain-containing protein [Gammaproteobacteria bacterium]
CIAIIKKRPENALRKLRGKSIGQVGVSSITVAELSFGAAKSSKAAEARLALTEFLLALEIAVFDHDAAIAYGEVRSSLARRGTPIGPLDTLIAAHALTIDAVLVSHNLREFKRVEGLRVEDWLATRQRH